MSRQQSPIQVFEHTCIYTFLNDEGKYLTRGQFNKLCDFNDKHGNKYFTVLRNGIKFKSYVGVLQVGNVTIEILPKTDNEDVQLWHKVLLQMLADCRKIKKELVTEANLRKKRSILELYIEMYLDEVERLVHQGLTKRYKKNRDQVNALKGKLLFADHIKSNIVHKQRFYTEHTVYNNDNTYNQLVKAGLQVISNLNCPSYLKDRSNSLLLHFHQVSNKYRIGEKCFDQLDYGRNTEKYREALKIAKILILNYSPDIIAGSENMLAILFNMNDLWEEYIYRQLLKSKEENIQVLPQRRKKFWQNKEIKPDIVIKKVDETIIIDTKWKALDQIEPSDNDLKQMFAYNLYWDCTHSILLYPKTKSSPDPTYGDFHKGIEEKHGCTLLFVDILNEEGNLRSDVHKDIWKILEA